MKSIMLSIQPKWGALTLNGDKTIEIRNRRPNCDLPIDVLMYITKGKPYLYKDYDKELTGEVAFVSGETPTQDDEQYLSGKVVAKFTLNTVEEIPPMYKWRKDYEKHLEENACISQKDLFAYLDMHKPTRCGYAWHISNLVIFDKPKELSEFGLKRAAQSWQYVDVVEKQ